MKMKNEHVIYRTTVLIPNYNGMKYIENCLDSIGACGDYPVIVVDNGSTDGSDAFIEENYPFVKLIRLYENTGFCHAVNVGLKAVETKYVFLLNNDTVIEDGAIEALEKKMDSNVLIFSAQSRILTMLNHDLADDCGDLYCALGWAFARGKNGDCNRYLKDVDIFSGCGAAVMYRMSLFDEIGNFDENHFAYLEDVDLGYRARIHGFRNVYVPDSVIYHAGSATSGSRYNKFKVDLSSANSIYLIYKNMPLLQIVINIPFLLAGYIIKAVFFMKKGLGLTYFKGILKGFGKCRRDIHDCCRHKVLPRRKYAFNYLKIQLELWINIFKRFGS